MPSNQDFEDGNDDIMSETIEKSPGVYVRTGEYQPHELDMLWSGSRHFAKEDRSPVVFTVVGLIVGAIVTSAIFFLFNAKPEIKAGENDLIVPIVDETELVPTAGDPIMSPEEMAQPKPEEPAPVAAVTPATSPAKGTTYVVRNGDTLEKIAKRHYGSGTPAMINKISRANNMRNPNSLKIGQKLVIPPKNY